MHFTSLLLSLVTKPHYLKDRYYSCLKYKLERQTCLLKLHLTELSDVSILKLLTKWENSVKS